MKLITQKSSEIKAQIASGLKGVFEKEGYEFKKSNNWFVKLCADFEFIIYLLLHSRSDHYSIEVFLFIRHKQVEKILKKIIGSSSNITMGNTIGVIYNSPDGKQVINNSMEILLIEDADIFSCIETIEQYYRDIIKPYFLKYNDLKSIDNIFNNPPFEHNPAAVGGMFDERCMRGLIVDSLLGSRHFWELCDIYDNAILRTMNEESIQQYHLVKNFLSSHKL